MKKKLTLSLILTFLMLYSLAVTISASEMHNTTTTTINMVREIAIGKVQLSWSKKAVDGYQVKWSRYSNMSSGKTASTTKTSWSRSGLAGGKTYYFTVRTYKLNNGKKDYSAWSAVRSLKLKKMPGTTVITSLTANSKSGFTVKWKKISGVKGYQLRFSTDSSYTTKKTASTTSCSHSRSSLAKGRYYVSVRTYNIADDGTKYYSAWSASKQVDVSSAGSSETTSTFDLKDYVNKDYRLLRDKIPGMVYWNRASDPAGQGNIYLLSQGSGFFFRYDLSNMNIYLIQNGGERPDISLYGVKIGMDSAKAKNTLTSQGWSYTGQSSASWGYWMEFLNSGHRIRVAVRSGKVDSYQWYR